ncbi:MAG: nuclear transport factor 2 family protein [Myxococcota bacterium]|nr:nuclear transport factor 2 family protein [Myxococcota bacterium]
MDEIQRLIAHDEIRRLIGLYAQLVDSGRLEEWSHLFCAEASLRVYGQTYHGRQEIREEIGAMQPPPNRAVKHLCAIPVIDLLASDHALVWTDFTAFTMDEEGQAEVATLGRYYDELKREESGWRIWTRTITLANQPLPSDLKPSPAD